MSAMIARCVLTTPPDKNRANYRMSCLFSWKSPQRPYVHRPHHNSYQTNTQANQNNHDVPMSPTD
eukprot:5695176-Amphidinium_carterae.1